MKVLMRAVKPHAYEGVDRAVDTTYEADEPFVGALLAGGVAVRAGEIETRDLAAGDAGQYQTRELLHLPRGKRARPN